MWAISHIVFAYLHFVPGGNGGWTKGDDYPRFSTEDRREILIPIEAYWPVAIVYKQNRSISLGRNYDFQGFLHSPFKPGTHSWVGCDLSRSTFLGSFVRGL